MIDTTFMYKTAYNVYGLGVSQIQEEAFCRLRVNGTVAIATEQSNSKVICLTASSQPML